MHTCRALNAIFFCVEKSVIDFSLPSSVTVTDLPPVRDSYMDTPQNQAMTTEFIRKYYALYDGEKKQREQLFSVYASDACFSLAVAKGQRIGFIDQQYIGANRNLLELCGDAKADDRRALLKIGPVHVVHLLSTLPRTKHQVDQFVADVFLIPNKQMLSVTIKGTFVDCDTNEVRTFHRVFLLVPVPSNASNSPFPALITNDELYIGAAKASLPSPANFSGSLSSSLSSAPPPSLSSPPLSAPPQSLPMPSSSTLPQQQQLVCSPSANCFAIAGNYTGQM